MAGKTDNNSENVDIEAGTQQGLRQGSKRRALKMLAAAGALGSAALLPERWLKPVVESVVLPAHAQASCGPLVLSGQSSDCNSADINYRTAFYIDDTSSSCPTFAPYTFVGDGPWPNYVLTLTHTKNSAGPHYIYLEQESGPRLFRAEARCDNLGQAPVLENLTPYIVPSISGQLYTLTVTGHANDPAPREILISDLVFIPV